ncbi:pyocin S6 family toxin immunity protein [Pseudomonas lundensis]|nr:pyocin S6 family toxin immunity protein [Pseudomonas lundensis]
MAEGGWLLSSEQAAQILKILGQALPTGLKLFRDVEA